MMTKGYEPPENRIADLKRALATAEAERDKMRADLARKERQLEAIWRFTQSEKCDDCAANGTDHCAEEDCIVCLLKAQKAERPEGAR